MTTAQARIKAMVSSMHQRHLKPLGFRKNANTWRRGEPWTQVINVQLSSWNSAEEAKITLNLGVFIPELHALLERSAPKGDVKEYDCDLRARIGSLTPANADKWWTITPATDAKALADELFSEIAAFALPWLARLTNLSDVASEFTGKKQHFTATAAHILRGDQAKAEEFLAKAYVSCNEYALGTLRKWAQTYSIPLPA